MPARLPGSMQTTVLDSLASYCCCDLADSVFEEDAIVEDFVGVEIVTVVSSNNLYSNDQSFHTRNKLNTPQNALYHTIAMNVSAVVVTIVQEVLVVVFFCVGGLAGGLGLPHLVLLAFSSVVLVSLQPIYEMCPLSLMLSAKQLQNPQSSEEPSYSEYMG